MVFAFHREMFLPLLSRSVARSLQDVAPRKRKIPSSGNNNIREMQEIPRRAALLFFDISFFYFLFLLSSRAHEIEPNMIWRKKKNFFLIKKNGNCAVGGGRKEVTSFPHRPIISTYLFSSPFLRQCRRVISEPKLMSVPAKRRYII